jgi:hypothetical protein
VSSPLRAPAGVNAGWCTVWDGTELVCDLKPGHEPGVRDHRGHVQIDGRGRFREVWFDVGDKTREAVVIPPAVPPTMTEPTILDFKEEPVPPTPAERRPRRLRLTLPAEYPQTLAGAIDALARLSTLAAAHEVPADAKLRLTLSMGGKITGGQFRWEA